MKHYLTCGFLILCASGMADIVYTNHYVWTNSPYPGTPYNAWTNAAHEIQTAVNHASAGDTVWVTNGIYTNSLNGVSNSSQVSITNQITLRSVNGAEATVIDGNYPYVTNRCVAVSGVGANGAVVDGFTLTNGYLTNGYTGAGIWIWSKYPSCSNITRNCIITGNRTDGPGGGICMGKVDGTYNGGVVSNCIIRGNSAGNVFPGGGGGVFIFLLGILSNCKIEGNTAPAYVGGGVHVRSLASPGKIENCQIIGNACMMMGGGLYIVQSEPLIRNCLIASNNCTGTAANCGRGGGIGMGGVAISGYIPKVENCTIVMNHAAVQGGGIYRLAVATGTVENTIIDLNSAPEGSAVYTTNSIISFTNCSFQSRADVTNAYCLTNANCLFEINNGFVNTNAGNYRLTANSPCVNAGINRGWMTNSVDLDDRERIRYGTVDMGAYEAIYNGFIYHAW